MARPCRQALCPLLGGDTAIAGDLARRTQISAFPQRAEAATTNLKLSSDCYPRLIFLFPRPVSRTCDPPGLECLSRYQSPHAKARQRQLFTFLQIGHLPILLESPAKRVSISYARTEVLRDRASTLLQSRQISAYHRNGPVTRIDAR